MQDVITRNREKIAELCRTHHVRRLSVFGSAVREDFNPETSDIDLLVEFDRAAIHSYLQNFFSLKDSLAALFLRRVDLVSAGALENPYLIASIEQDREMLYAA